MMCLDSDFIVANLRGDEKAINLARKLEADDILATTAVNYYEILSGAMLSGQRARRVAEARAILGRLEILPFRQDEAELISKIYADLSLEGKMVSQKDVFIGGIALANGAEVVTRNVWDFERIPGLKVRKW